MILNQPDWTDKLLSSLNELCNKYSIRFKDILPRDLPDRSGVYLITKVEDDFEIPYWLEWADSIKHRIHGGLLMGGFARKSLKKELVARNICSSIEEAKQFIRENCAVRWLRVKDPRFRNALAYFGQGIMVPKCGILELSDD